VLEGSIQRGVCTAVIFMVAAVDPEPVATVAWNKQFKLVISGRIAAAHLRRFIDQAQRNRLAMACSL
jgi:hypothetical protein